MPQHSNSIIPDINAVLTSSENYIKAFDAGLLRILDHKTAGTFILAAANLFQDPQNLRQHCTKLTDVYQTILDYYQHCKQNKLQPDDAEDDIRVMQSLIEIGLDKIDLVITSKVRQDKTEFLLNYNPLRSFRPARMSNITNFELNLPFNPNGFHFDKPFLDKEIFSEGEYAGKSISCLYNKFPIMNLHALLVINKQQHLNQYLTEEYLRYISELQTAGEQAIPGFIIAYNSLGAGASVNHLHFHACLDAQALPIFSSIYKHNGGDIHYPANCIILDSTSDAWPYIDSLHQKNNPYNLLFRNNKVFCFPRRPAEKDIKDLDTSMFGWSHLAGYFNVDNKDMLTTFQVKQLANALNEVSASLKTGIS